MSVTILFFLLLVVFGIIPLPIAAFLFMTLFFGVGVWMAVLPGF